MVKIIFKDKYSDDFKKKLPNILYNYVKAHTNKNDYDYLKSLIMKQFDISFEQLLALYKDNLHISTKNGNMIISLDNNAYYKGTKIESIIDEITYGSTRISKNDMFLKAAQYLKNNIFNLYLLFKIRKESKLWQ